MTFNFSGATVSQVTPWITDANNNLTRQTAIASRAPVSTTP
jgi:hypothetical protein